MTKAELLHKTKAELLTLARRLGLRGISTLRKTPLIERILRARAQRKRPAAKIVSPKPALPLPEAKRRAVRKQLAGKAPAARRRRRQRSAVRRGARRPSRARPIPAAAAPEAAVTAGKIAVRPPPAPVVAPTGGEPGALPEAYGTGRLFLAARDPGWLQAQWDLNKRQLAEYRRQAADGRLILRLFEQGAPEPVQEIVLTPAARSWYLPVNKAAARYRVQLGYHRRGGGFHLISTSRDAVTPAAQISAATRATFVIFPLVVPLQEVFPHLREPGPEAEQLAYTLNQLRAEGYAVPDRVVLELADWPAEHAERLLQALLAEGAGARASSVDSAALARRESAPARASGRRAHRRGGRS